MKNKSKYTGILQEELTTKEKNRTYAYYRVKKEYVPVSIMVEFKLKKTCSADIPNKMEFFYNEKTRKWSAEFIEIYT